MSLVASFAPSLRSAGANDATRATNKLYALQTLSDHDCPIYTALACSLAISTNLNFDFDFDFCNAKFDWFVRYQMRVFIGY